MIQRRSRTFIIIIIIIFVFNLWDNSNPPTQTYSKPYLQPYLQPSPPLPPNAPLSICAYPPLTHYRDLPDNGKVCVSIRTYIGQITDDKYPIKRLLTCLEQMEYQNWVAVIYPTDLRNITGIDEILASRDVKFRGKYKVVFPPPLPYVDTEFGYNMTDWGTKNGCPSDTKWLLTTNGDNEYSPVFFNYLFDQFDGITFDFFSRYQRKDHYYEKFNDAYGEGIPKPGDICSKWSVRCMISEPRVDFIDLGAAIWNYDRWRKEDMSYSKFSPVCCHDGVLSKYLHEHGWRLTKIPYCLFSHSPNLWSGCHHGFNGDP